MLIPKRAWPRVPSSRIENPTPHGANGPHGDAERPPCTPQEWLQRLPLGTKDWRRVLVELLKLHNARHSSKDKVVAFETTHDRGQFLFAYFEELRSKTKYRIEPRQLAGRHVTLMARRWIERGLATATIHNYLSYLRTFSTWIGRAGMVRSPEFYVGAGSPLAHRRQAATIDKSWTAHGVDIDAKIAEITSFDPWVGLQLELCFAFGLRPKESRHFRPHDPLIPRNRARARDADVFPDCAEFVRVQYGTKGGRVRDVALTTSEQRDVLERSRAAVAPGMFVGRPEHSPAQSEARFYYVVRKFGISKRSLGIVAHGLRHQRANDVHAAHAGGPSPVRGGVQKPPRDDEARAQVASMLGHGRVKVTCCYLGQSVVMRSSALDQHDVSGQPDKTESDSTPTIESS